MDRTRFGRTCPVCAGPLVTGEGGAGCVLCGYAIESQRRLRSRGVRVPRITAARRPRQLLLPLNAA